MSKHAKFSPSASEKWMNCHGALALEAKCPEEDSSVFAAEGTAAHALLETCLLKNEDAEEWIGEEFEDFTVTVEMAEAVQVAIDTIREDLDKFGGTLFVERKVKILGSDVYGTVDIVIYETFGKLRVYDYKHGRGIKVNATENKQMLSYAVGLIDEFPCEDVELCIIQPRAKDATEEDRGVSRWECGVDRVRTHKEDIANAVKAIKAGSTTRVKGAHCKKCFCKARAICPEYRGEALQELSKVGVNLTLPAAESLSNDDIVRILNVREQMEDWFKQVYQFASTKVEMGDTLDGWEIDIKRGNRAWINGKEVIERYHEELGDDIFVIKKSVISPAQLEKRLGKGRKKELEGLYERPFRGTVLKKVKTK